MNSPFPSAPKTISPSILRDKSIRELQQFYQKPIAKVSTELIITIFTVIALALFAIRPTLNTMSTLVKDIQDKQKVDEELTKKAAALSTLNSELVPLAGEIATLNKVIPNTPDLDGLLRRMEKLASGRPIVLSSIQSNYSPKENDPDLTGTAELSTLTVQFGIKGTYADILDYLNAMQQMDREVTVTSLAIVTQQDFVSSAQDEPQALTAPQLQLSVTIQARYFGIPVEAAEGTS